MLPYQTTELYVPPTSTTLKILVLLICGKLYGYNLSSNEVINKTVIENLLNARQMVMRR